MSRLKMLRETKQREQKALAEYLEISPASYSKKESGQIRFSLIEAKKLAMYFNKPIEEIFFNEEINGKKEND